MATKSDGNVDGDDEMASRPQEEIVAAENSKNDANEPLVDNGASSDKSDTKHGSEYEKFIVYDANGTAIYTDPSTNIKYTFNAVTNQWVPCESNASNENPYENEHYRWCHETNKWILKENVTAANVTETEFYRWDNEKRQWIPKMTNQDDVASECTDGVHTYTDKDGIVFFWDVEKNAWIPKIDDLFMAVYQMNYGFIDNTTESTVKKDEKKCDDESTNKIIDSNTETVAEPEASVESKEKAAKRKAEASKFICIVHLCIEHYFN